ncbi:MAG: hypothetical protein ACR2IE_10725 [Candidatus Sumerlaeaceae bacterium]
MIDTTVERQYSDTKELLALWRTFYDYFVLGVKNDNITPEKEGQFLEIKSRIAMLHDSFMEALTANQNIGQEVLNIISRAITLKHLSKQSTADVKKMEIEWHESYLLLNETIGVLEDKRNELAQVNEAQYRAGKVAGVARQKVTGFFTSGGFKLAVIIIVVLFGTIGIQWFGIFDWDELGKVKALNAPYGWGKALVRKFYDPDSPWPAIDAMFRKPQSTWPVGVGVPELKGEPKDEFIAKVPVAAMQPLLAQATEYRKETASVRNKDPVQIHTFLFANTATAKQAIEEWEKVANANLAMKDNLDFFRNVNIINSVAHSDKDVVNGFRVQVFEAAP